MVAALINIIRLLLRHGDDMACPRWLPSPSACIGAGAASRCSSMSRRAGFRRLGARPDSVAGGQPLAATAAAVALTVFLRGTPG
jgi:hypothetical protein